VHYKEGVLIKGGWSGPDLDRLSGTLTTVIFHRDFVLPGHTVDLEVAYFSLQRGRERDSQCVLQFKGIGSSHEMP
jgi:hypothetical protein